MSVDRPAVLFLCVANSARSQMAEGLARSLAPELEVYSAGSEPARVHPLAHAAMAEIGIDLGAHRSKPIDAVPLERIGTIITLCEDEVCPVVPGDVTRHHWPFEDPAAGSGIGGFRQVRDEIAARLEAWLGKR